MKTIRNESSVHICIYTYIYIYIQRGSCICQVHVTCQPLASAYMQALISSRALTSGWRALLRCCPGVCDRLDVLGDARLKARPLPAQRFTAVPGQESEYDLTKAELFIEVDFPRTSHGGTTQVPYVWGVLGRRISGCSLEIHN